MSSCHRSSTFNCDAAEIRSRTPEIWLKIRPAALFPDVKIVRTRRLPWLEMRATHCWSVRRVVAASWCDPSPPSRVKTFHALATKALSPASMAVL